MPWLRYNDINDDNNDNNNNNNNNINNNNEYNNYIIRSFSIFCCKYDIVSAISVTCLQHLKWHFRTRFFFIKIKSYFVTCKRRGFQNFDVIMFPDTHDWFLYIFLKYKYDFIWAEYNTSANMTCIWNDSNLPSCGNINNFWKLPKLSYSLLTKEDYPLTFHSFHEILAE